MANCSTGEIRLTDTYCTGSVWFSRNFVRFGEFFYSLISTTQHTFDVFAPSPQVGSTVVLLAAHKGHKDLVQELCEIYVADILHKKKVRAMQTVSGSEWLNELCMCVCIYL